MYISEADTIPDTLRSSSQSQSGQVCSISPNNHHHQQQQHTQNNSHHSSLSTAKAQSQSLNTLLSWHVFSLVIELSIMLLPNCSRNYLFRDWILFRLIQMSTEVFFGPLSCLPVLSRVDSSCMTTPVNSSSPRSRPHWTPWCLCPKSYSPVWWCVTLTRLESLCSMNWDFMTMKH